MPIRTPTRTRMTDTDRVLNLDQAEERLRQMREFREEQRAIFDQVLKEIEPIINLHQLEFETLDAKYETNLLALERFWNTEKKHHKTKSKQLVNGKIGTRVVGGGWQMPEDKDLLKKLKEIKRNDLIITKETPDKKAIKQKENKSIHKKLGVSRVPGTDEFFAQIEGDPVSLFLQLRAAVKDRSKEKEEE